MTLWITGRRTAGERPGGDAAAARKASSAMAFFRRLSFAALRPRHSRRLSSLEGACAFAAAAAERAAREREGLAASTEAARRCACVATR